MSSSVRGVLLVATVALVALTGVVAVADESGDDDEQQPEVTSQQEDDEADDDEDEKADDGDDTDDEDEKADELPDEAAIAAMEPGAQDSPGQGSLTALDDEEEAGQERCPPEHGEDTTRCGLDQSDHPDRPDVAVEFDVEEFEVDGGCEEAIVARIVRQNWRQMQHCYESTLSEDDDGGRVELSWVVAPSGDVPSVSMEESTLDNEDAEQCMVRVTDRMSFPETDGGRVCQVDSTVTFQVEQLDSKRDLEKLD